MPFALLTAVVVHEIGHMLAAGLAGWQPHILAIGPLAVGWETGGLRVTWHWPTGGAAGMVVAAPPPGRPAVRSAALVIAGGPIMNLMTGLLAGALFRSMKPASPPSPKLLVGLIAVASVLLGVASLIPWRAGGASDGLRLLHLWRGGPQAERESALAALNSLIRAGVRPSDWPEHLLKQATALSDGTAAEGAGQILAFYRALDQGRSHLATAHLARALQLVEAQHPAVRSVYYLEAAYVTALLEGDAAKAAEYLALGAGGLGVEPHGRLRCEAAVLLAQGLSVRAMERIDLALAMLAAKERTGTDHLEEALLQDLQARCARAIAGLR